ncbi:MAG: hypothetical protein QGH76_03665 [Phycisphaerales bacterium]|jgi:hypothetical protein|nr:hypothetical protein [Phycisphaerales bacterium]
MNPQCLWHNMPVRPRGELVELPLLQFAKAASEAALAASSRIPMQSAGAGDLIQQAADLAVLHFSGFGVPGSQCGQEGLGLVLDLPFPPLVPGSPGGVLPYSLLG